MIRSDENAVKNGFYLPFRMIISVSVALIFCILPPVRSSVFVKL